MKEILMRRVKFSGMVAGLLILSGCLNSRLPVAPPATPGQLEAIRAEYRKADPEARVGVVTEVLASANLASVGDVPTKDFSIGDVITFEDSNEQTLTMGKVEAVYSKSLTVRYDPPPEHGRAPVQGDVAIRAIH